MSFMHFVEHRVTEADLVELREWEAARAAPRGVNPLRPAPLSTPPAQFAGSVDATHERTTPCPRTLEQAFGPAANGGVIVPLTPDAPMHKADRIVTVGSLIAAIVLVPILIWTRSA